MNKGVEMNVYGVRGSSPISGSDFAEFGGNTASLTIRTPQNSLLFLDAGTGIRVAEVELDNPADKVFLLISHTHADHIQGLGMTQLPWLDSINGYQNQLLRIIGPSQLVKGLEKYYDGNIIWPVIFSPNSEIRPRMTGIDYNSVFEFSETNKSCYIDDSATLHMMKGNHPVRDGVVLYRLEINNSDNKFIIVYATDNEFDFIEINHPNPEVDLYKQQYMNFIADADYLIADAQYTDDDYHNFQGYGHSYHQQVIDLAEKSNVKNLILTHHHLYEDDKLNHLEKDLQNYIMQNNCRLSLKLAREGMKMKI